MPLHLLAAQGLSPLADPDPLPPAPFFERYFLQDPLPTAIFLFIIAATGWWWLQRVGKPKESWIVALVCPLLAGGVLLLAKLVVTEREALVIRATELVNLALEARANDVAPYLRSDVALTLLSRQSRGDRALILDRIREDQIKKYQAKETFLKWVTATIDGPNVARTQCRVNIETQALGFATPSTWMIHWTRENEHAPWQVRLIDLQQFGLFQQNGLPDI